MRFAKLPNLELLQNTAEIALQQQNLLEKQPEFEVECYPQWWSSTSTGFDMTKTGETVFGDSVMTNEYTTVVHELVSDAYFVFFGDKICYEVLDASDEFFKDLKNRSLKPLSEAIVKYVKLETE